VIWYRLDDINVCLTLEPNTYTVGIHLDGYELRRVDTRKVFIFVDGYKAQDAHKAFFNRLAGQLRKEDRIVICCSLAILGKRSEEDNERYEKFHVPSWTKEEYLSAMANDAFYQSVKVNLDAQQVLLSEMLEVHEEDESDDEDESVSVTEKKEQALISKFYYAGGSCRFMFQYPTKRVMEELVKSLNSVPDKQVLISYPYGKYLQHSDEIDRLFGMTSSGEPFFVSRYVTFLLAKQSDPETIAALARRLNSQGY